MRVNGDRTDPRGLGDVTDMRPITRLINAEVIKKGQQQGGDDAMGDKHVRFPEEMATGRSEL
jgi:hypothetical protein